MGNSIHTKKRTPEERWELWKKVRRTLCDGYNQKQVAHTLGVSTACITALRRDFEPTFTPKKK